MTTPEGPGLISHVAELYRQYSDGRTMDELRQPVIRLCRAYLDTEDDACLVPRSLLTEAAEQLRNGYGYDTDLILRLREAAATKGAQT